MYNDDIFKQREKEENIFCNLRDFLLSKEIDIKLLDALIQARANYFNASSGELSKALKDFHKATEYSCKIIIDNNEKHEARKELSKSAENVSKSLKTTEKASDDLIKAINDIAEYIYSYYNLHQSVK